MAESNLLDILQIYKKCLKSGARAALVLLLVLTAAGGLVTCLSALSWINSSSGQAASANQTLSTDSNRTELLFECELPFLKMDPSMMKFAVHYLELVSNDTFKIAQVGRSEASRAFNELSTKLDVRLPFVFFINGFNAFTPSNSTESEVDDTWLYRVVQSFAKRAIDRKRNRMLQEKRNSRSLMSRIQRFGFRTMQASRAVFNSILDRGNTTASTRRKNSSRGEIQPEGRNVILLTWSIPDLLTSNMLALVPAYYKTVANYDLIVEGITRDLLDFVDMVEQTMQFTSNEERSNYYKQFQFYGHSLGGHILADALLRAVREIQTRSAGESKTTSEIVRFGRISGLDPATPCFESDKYGISSPRIVNAVDEVVVLHTNAGFVGIPSERANLEIVLNGGSFQPGCGWYELQCNHMRATEILGYIDDECQMVAYKCTSYQHFKMGACEVCLDDGNSDENSRGNCALVNLPEQHQDRPQLLAHAERMSNTTRQLAATFDEAQLDWPNESMNEIPSRQAGARLLRKSPVRQDLNETDAKVEAKKSSRFYYVNTNANFRFGRKSHCLQHYQLRLLTYNEDARLRERCKLSSFFVRSSDEIKVRLLYEVATDADHRPHTNSARQTGNRKYSQRRLVSKMVRDSNDFGIYSDEVKLGAVVKDVFHTALVNFEAEPVLFVGAQLRNLNVAKLMDCYQRNNATSGPRFVLDIAFMSNLKQSIRNAFSSVMCGQLKLPSVPLNESLENPQSDKGITNDVERPSNKSLGLTGRRDHLTLSLCKQSELKNVSAEIDKLLGQIKLQMFNDSWKVLLLNSLFSLFIEWEPL